MCQRRAVSAHSLVVAVAQPRNVLGDVASNAVAHADAVRRAEARVVVFPEMSLTGYDLDAAVVDVGDHRLGPLLDACAATGTLALAGAAVVGPTDRSRSIGVLAVAPTGVVDVAYRKMWLGAVERAAGFEPGHEPAVVEVDGWRLGLAVCKDTGHPEHAAATAARGIDAYVAGIVHGADEADEHERRARRVIADHGVAVAIASFVGPTGGGYDETAGRSAIWAADGTVLALAGSDPGEIVRAELARPPR